MKNNVLRADTSWQRQSRATWNTPVESFNGSNVRALQPKHICNTTSRGLKLKHNIWALQLNAQPLSPSMQQCLIHSVWARSLKTHDLERFDIKHTVQALESKHNVSVLQLQTLGCLETEVPRRCSTYVWHHTFIIAIWPIHEQFLLHQHFLVREAPNKWSVASWWHYIVWAPRCLKFTLRY